MSPRMLRLARIRNRPRPASRPSHHLRYKGRWRAPHAEHGEEGQWAQHRFRPLSPPRSEPARSPAPPPGREWGALRDANPPVPRLSSQQPGASAAAARPEAPAHTRRSVALPAAPALGPGAQGPSARRPPHGRSCAHRAPASPELWGMQARGKGPVRAGRPVRASRPQPGEGSPASRGGRGTHLPSGKSLESSKRPREPGPPSAGGTSAPRTTKTGRTYLFVQRRLHLAASLISGCGLR